MCVIALLGQVQKFFLDLLAVVPLDEIAPGKRYPLGIGVFNGSDAHSLDQVGLVYTEMEEFTDATGFISALREATLHGKRYSPWVSQWDRWKARMRKTRP